MTAQTEAEQPAWQTLVATITVNDAMGANFHFTRPHTLLPGQVLYVYTAPPPSNLTLLQQCLDLLESMPVKHSQQGVKRRELCDKIHSTLTNQKEPT